MLIMKSSLEALLIQFRDFDKLSIVTFSNRSKVELELTCMNVVGRKRANDVISGLKVSGSTNMEAGLLNGIDIFSEVGFSHILYYTQCVSIYSYYQTLKGFAPILRSGGWSALLTRSKVWNLELGHF